MPIVDKLKEALKPGRKDTGDEGDLNKLLASSAKKVLLQKIEFEPASKGFSYQLDSLKTKYVILNPRNEGATGQKAIEPTQIKRQGKLLKTLTEKKNGDTLDFTQISKLDFAHHFPFSSMIIASFGNLLYCCCSNVITKLTAVFSPSLRECGWGPE